MCTKKVDWRRVFELGEEKEKNEGKRNRGCIDKEGGKEGGREGSRVVKRTSLL